MCGRSSLTKTEKEIEARFSATFYSDELERYNPIPNHNISPSQMIPVITNQDSEHLRLHRWGLIPFWAKDIKIGYKMFNARKETLLEKPAFKNAAKQRRCLVVMDSFYEWKKEGKKKRPYKIGLKDESLFSVAGLWESWDNKESGETVHSCTIITQEPNKFMSELHDRMPAILPAHTERLWIDDEIPATEAIQMLEPIESNVMHAFEMDPIKGKPDSKNDNQQMSLF